MGVGMRVTVRVTVTPAVSCTYTPFHPNPSNPSHHPSPLISPRISLPRHRNDVNANTRAYSLGSDSLASHGDSRKDFNPRYF